MMQLMMRAQRMQDEVTRELDFHDYNAVPWDAEKPKWGQKKWKSKMECKSDVEKMQSVRQRNNKLNSHILTTQHKSHNKSHTHKHTLSCSPKVNKKHPPVQSPRLAARPTSAYFQRAQLTPIDQN
jgi:hypothetical protein